MSLGLVALVFFVLGIVQLIDTWTGNTPRAIAREIESEIASQNAYLREIAEKMESHLCFIKIDNNVFYAQVSPDYTRVQKIIEKVEVSSGMDTDNIYVYDWEDVGE